MDSEELLDRVYCGRIETPWECFLKAAGDARAALVKLNAVVMDQPSPAQHAQEIAGMVNKIERMVRDRSPQTREVT